MFNDIMGFLGIGSLISAVILIGVKMIVGRMEQRMDLRTKTRIEENMLMMKGICSTGGLSEAVAIAQKRGSANGEIDDALAKYRSFRDDLEKFQSTQTATHLHGGT